MVDDVPALSANIVRGGSFRAPIRRPDQNESAHWPVRVTGYGVIAGFDVPYKDFCTRGNWQWPQVTA